MSLSTAILTLILPLTFSHTFGSTARRLALDGGLAFHWLAGMTIAIYSAHTINNLARRSGTESMTRVAPVPPALLYLARYAGICTVLIIFSFTTGLATLLAERIAEAFTPEIGFRIDLTTAFFSVLGILLAILLAAVFNFLFNIHFHSAALCLLPLMLGGVAAGTGFYNRAGELTASFEWNLSVHILPATLLITIVLFVIGSLALWLSLWLKPFSLGVICFMILSGGLISQWLLMQPFSLVSRSLILLIPNWQPFWNSATASAPGLYPLWPLLFYAATLIGTFLILGIYSFQKTECES